MRRGSVRPIFHANLALPGRRIRSGRNVRGVATTSDKQEPRKKRTPYPRSTRHTGVPQKHRSVGSRIKSASGVDGGALEFTATTPPTLCPGLNWVPSVPRWRGRLGSRIKSASVGVRVERLFPYLVTPNHAVPEARPGYPVAHGSSALLGCRIRSGRTVRGVAIKGSVRQVGPEFLHLVEEAVRLGVVPLAPAVPALGGELLQQFLLAP